MSFSNKLLKQHPEVLRLCDETAIDLIQLYRKQKKIDSEYEGKLIFPKVRDKAEQLRISEQEARFLFARRIEVDEENEFTYSIETPTQLRYAKFSSDYPKVYYKDEAGRSASIDLSLYHGEVKYPIINIEFKSGQPKPRAVTKDILKLCAEGHELGIYYHLLEHSKERTVRSVVCKLNNALKIIDGIINPGKLHGGLKNPILIFIIVLEPEKDLNKRRSIIYKYVIEKLSDQVRCDKESDLYPYEHIID